MFEEFFCLSCCKASICVDLKCRRLYPTPRTLHMAPGIRCAFSATSDLGNNFGIHVGLWTHFLHRAPFLFHFCFLSCVSLMCTFRNCLASRQPLLLATLRNISSLSDHQIIFQICKGLGYGISDEARICPLCPHESPHASHAEFACSIRIEAIRTMSRIFRYMTQS